jgi:hypothetical protein
MIDVKKSGYSIIYITKNNFDDLIGEKITHKRWNIVRDRRNKIIYYIDKRQKHA